MSMMTTLNSLQLLPLGRGTFNVRRQEREGQHAHDQKDHESLCRIMGKFITIFLSDFKIGCISLNEKLTDLFIILIWF